MKNCIQSLFCVIYHRGTIIHVLLFLSSIWAQQTSFDSLSLNRVGSLMVTSDPSHAEIILNGQKINRKTPSLLKNIPAGMNTIELSLPDYLFAQRQVAIVPDSTVSISFKLLSLSDTAHIIGDLKLGILSLPRPPLNNPYLVDSRQVFSQEITLNTGKHHVVWEGGNLYSSLDTIVEIYPGRLTTFLFNPQRLTGKLTVSPFPPDANVYINDRLYSTGEVSVSFPTGLYTVTVKRNGYFPEERQIQVLAQKDSVVSISLVHIPDRDQDGFLDSCDQCPDTYGLYDGCPKIKRSRALKRYAQVLRNNMHDDPLCVAFTAAGYLHRNPTNKYFREFISYFNNGSSFLNNYSGLHFFNTLSISFRGFFILAELGQWNSGLAYKKRQPLYVTTTSGDYCIVYDTSETIFPRIYIPGTALSAGFNFTVFDFTIAATVGYQWEDIKISDIITKENYELFKAKDSSVTQFNKYIGPKTQVVFDNDWWFINVWIDRDLPLRTERMRLSLFVSTKLSFGAWNKTGWHSMQTGILTKLFPGNKEKKR